MLEWETRPGCSSRRTPMSLGSAFGSSHILIADDQEPNVRFLEYILESAGYGNLRGITDSRQIIPACKQTRPDLILLDLHMPHRSEEHTSELQSLAYLV